MGCNEKIRVCHLISGDLWAGAEVQAYTLLRKLAVQTELDLCVIVLNEGTLAENLRAVGIEVTVIDESKFGFFEILRRTRKHLEGRNTDIVHSHRRKENVLAGLLKRSGHTKYLVQTVHGAPEPFKGIKWFKERIYKALNHYFTNRYFDHILPVSDNLRDLLQKQLSRGRLTTVHNSIDLQQIKVSHNCDELRRELGLSGGGPVIGSAGRMVPVKGFDYFLRAARIILNTKPGAVFLLVGDGPLLGELKDLAAELGLEQRVKFPGFRTDVIDLLNCLDIFVVASHHEGVPTVVLEAMALKKPIVSTAVGGINEMIESNVSGLLVPPGDSEALADACLKIIDDNTLRETLGTNARKTAEQKFSAVNQAGRVLSIYFQLVGRSDHE